MAKRAKTNDKDVRRGRSAEREQRWDEIVHAAAAIFFEKGYEATSLQDIADAVGLLKGSIYYYIKTKEDLLFEVVIRAQQIWKEILVEDADLAKASAPIRLREFILRYMSLREREREWGIVAEREFGRLSPEYLDRVKLGRRQFTKFVREIVEQGVAEGDFDPHLDIELAANQVFELMKSSHLYRRPQGRRGVIGLADAYASFTIRGLGYAGWTPPRDE